LAGCREVAAAPNSSVRVWSDLRVGRSNSDCWSVTLAPWGGNRRLFARSRPSAEWLVTNALPAFHAGLLYFVAASDLLSSEAAFLRFRTAYKQSICINIKEILILPWFYIIYLNFLMFEIRVPLLRPLPEPPGSEFHDSTDFTPLAARA